MVRVVIPKTTIAAAFDATPCTTLSWTAADVTDFNRFQVSGQQLLLIRNVHATLARTYTLFTVADPQGRTKDLTAHELVAGAVHCLARLPITGFRQPDGYVYVNGSHVDIEFAVLDLSSQVGFTV